MEKKKEKEKEEVPNALKELVNFGLGGMFDHMAEDQDDDEKDQ